MKNRPDIFKVPSGCFSDIHDGKSLPGLLYCVGITRIGMEDNQK